MSSPTRKNRSNFAPPSLPGVVAFAILVFAAPALAAPLLYPLDAPSAVSGNFGQYRQGHPHSGVDLWTFLRLDVPVRAVADGVVYRVNTSPTGYGRVLYQRLIDGRIAVYGHLADFAPPLADLVARRQQRAGRYSVALDVSVPVLRGDLLGHAGDAGTDVPHLHFELRDAANQPINPLRHGLVIPDTRAPEFNAVHFEPLEGGLIDGTPAPYRLALRRDADGVYRGDRVRLAGRVGLAVEAYDRTDGTPRRLAPYELRLAADGAPLFVHRFDRADYARGYLGVLSYDQRLKETGVGQFIRLFRFHQRSLFHPEDRTGYLDALPLGAHLLQLTATDESGHAALAELPVEIEAPPPPGPAPRRPPVVATNGGTLASADGRARLSVPTDALFRDVPMTVDSPAIAPPAYLESVGPAYRFDAPWEPLCHPMNVTLSLPRGESPARVGVYLVDRGSWWHLGNGATAKTPVFGTFALARDVEPPRIGEVYFGSGDSPIIEIMADDRGSGLPESGIAVTLDGRRRIVEPVPLKGQLILRPGPLASGDHTLRIDLTDRAGNRASKSVSFSR